MMMKSKLVLTLALCGLLWACDGQSQPKPKPPSEKQTTAQAMFAERCKKAGVTIHKTVENVEGIFLMKLRPEKMNFGDQFRLDDPYGRDFGGDAAIKTLLRGQFQATHKDIPAVNFPPRIGYSYIEAIDPQDGKHYRYTGNVREVTKVRTVMMGGDGKTTFKTKEFALDRTESQSPMSRYGVTYDDISTREEREYWIAGSSLRVIDLQTNEVLAERIGYMMDWAQGSNAGGRSPWLFAADNACPAFTPGKGSSAQLYQTLDFVEKVLKHSSGK